MAALDLRLGFEFKYVARVSMFVAMFTAILNNFEPAFETEVFLWISVNCFIWQEIKGR